ncbi:hypothetical protein [Methylobacter sp.]|uniref:hypothetical protein n=1 Tax=Methylobacter sp. TaxID=2051955 RepID=UPI00248936E6|nr:hypothetical protein [Methylobacter sp.]MDI1279508.1 hypothetical protein [Methylobacter sp.]MDI1359266.1 hypothetical protein [Methylobacter sp.]
MLLKVVLKVVVVVVPDVLVVGALFVDKPGIGVLFVVVPDVDALGEDSALWGLTTTVGDALSELHTAFVTSDPATVEVDVLVTTGVPAT